MADLNEVINLRAFTDDRIGERTAVDRAVGADLHTILDDDTADLRHLEVAVRSHCETETVLADLRHPA